MNKFITQVKGIAGHELISGSFFIFLGTTISSALAFILNLFLVRSLSYAEYGIFAAIMSLILLLTIPSQSLTAVIVRYATKFFTAGEDARAGAFYFKLLKYLLLFGTLVIIGFTVLAPFIADFLKIKDLSVIIIAGVTVAAMYLMILNAAFLQSMLLFNRVGLLNIFSAIGKLLVGILLVYAGFKAFGALVGNLMYPVINYFGGLIFLRKVLTNRGTSAHINVNEFARYALPTIVAILSLSSFITTDVILVKHYFSPDEAGLYGGVSLIGRVIFYFTAPIALVMFPLVVKRYTKGENYNSLLYLSLLLVLTAGISITIFYFLFPEFTINIFLGGRAYSGLAPLVGLFGVFLTLYSLNNVMISFFLSIKKTFVALIVFVFALMQIVLILFYHDTFRHVINVSITISMLLMIVLILYYLKVNGEKKVDVTNAA